MPQNKSWNDGDVLNIKLRDDLFSLAQMRISPYLMFFGIFNRDGKWSNVDLNSEQPLFCVPVAASRMKPIIAGKLNLASVTPNTNPMPRLFIKPNLIAGGNWPFRGGNLIEVDERGETTGRPVLKPNLSAQDADTLYQYELTNMWTDPEEARQRLILFFETGINWDPHKEKVFPGIAPPPPRYKPRVS